MYKTDNSIQARKLSHSELAMRAAKGMGRSKHKEKTGRVVCHHLLKMLESADREQGSGREPGRAASGAEATSRQLSGSSLAHRRNHAEQYSLRL